ncbi:MAG: co-chaperone GroES [Chloroflexi bacterium]|nr:co-chaperone GroES [Chloroflexota bacterium]
MSDLKLRPLADRLVVEPLEAENRTESGLFIPETAKEKPQQGKVVAVGPGAHKGNSGEHIPMDVEVGQTVLFGKYAGTDIKLNGKEYKILKENDVLAIVEDQ